MWWILLSIEWNSIRLGGPAWINNQNCSLAVVGLQGVVGMGSRDDGAVGG